MEAGGWAGGDEKRQLKPRCAGSDGWLAAVSEPVCCVFCEFMSHGGDFIKHRVGSGSTFLHIRSYLILSVLSPPSLSNNPRAVRSRASEVSSDLVGICAIHRRPRTPGQALWP